GRDHPPFQLALSDGRSCELRRCRCSDRSGGGALCCSFQEFAAFHLHSPFSGLRLIVLHAETADSASNSIAGLRRGQLRAKPDDRLFGRGLEGLPARIDESFERREATLV